MTIDNLEAIVSPSSEDLLLIRHSGKEWKYPLSTLASNLVNDPTISAATLGTASHPFKEANITTLNVGGSGTVNGNFSANSLNVTGSGTVGGTVTISGNAEADSLNVTNNLKVATLTGENDGDITKVAVSGTLSVKDLTAETAELIASSGDIKTSSITASALSSLTVSDSITTRTLSMTGGTLTVGSSGTVTVGSSSSESKYPMTVDSTGNITAPSLMLMADTTDTTVDLTKDEVLQEVLQGDKSDFLYTAGYLPNTECMIAGAPGEAYQTQYGYLLTVTGGLRVGRSKTEYNTTPDGRTNLNGKYNAYVTGIHKDGMIESGCAYKCYGTGKKIDSEGNETTAEGFLTSGGVVLSEDVQENEEEFFISLGGAIKTVGSIVSKSPILGSRVFNAVWNDLADCIPVNKEAIIEPGYCYCFDGEKYYKSTKYLEKGIIGIESDTYGMHMGSKPGTKQMDVAVSGFALAYVDKEYESGTPLTCTENGYLTEIAKQDKIEYPERIVGTYWKPEPNEEWGSSDRKVKVKGRHWIKIK